VSKALLKQPGYSETYIPVAFGPNWAIYSRILHS